MKQWGEDQLKQMQQFPWLWWRVHWKKGLTMEGNTLETCIFLYCLYHVSNLYIPPLIPKGTIVLHPWRRVGVDMRHHSLDRALQVIVQDSVLYTPCIVTVKPFHMHDCSVAAAQKFTGSGVHSEALGSNDYSKGAHSTAKPDWRW